MPTQTNEKFSLSNDSDNDEVYIGSTFEKLLDGVVSNGRYQWRLILIFLVPLAFCYCLAYFNYILLFSTPEHHCYIPGRNYTNSSIDEEWNNFTIPWERGSAGQMRLSRCKMFNDTPILQFHNENSLHDPGIPRESIDCQYGWEYDSSYWKSTPVTKFDWVCDKKKYVTLIFSANMAGSALGTLILPAISDRFGRKPVFFAAIFINFIFANSVIFAPSFGYFVVLKFLGATAFFTVYELAYIVVVELCSQRLRTMATLLTWLTAVLANGAISLAGWFLKDWKTYLLVTQLPLATFLLFWRLIPESPRWHLSRGNLVECEKTLTKIATTNKVSFTEDMQYLIEKAYKEDKRKIPPTKIFTSSVLAKHLALISLAKGLGYLSANGLNMNVHNMKGNIFLNYFLLRLFEVPGLILSTISMSYLGRRLSSVLCMILAGTFTLSATFFISDTWSLLLMVGTGKIFVRAFFYGIFIQTGELFPTPLRATAYGIAGIVTLVTTIFSPSIIAMASRNILLPYYIIGGICLIAAFIASFLPETFGRPLPQTLKDANQIGIGQSYFSFLPKRNSNKRLTGQKNVRENGEKNLLTSKII